MEVQVKDIIRAYDFKPMAGREDCYLEGEVLDRNDNTLGFQAFKVRVTRDVWAGEEQGDQSRRVGQIMYVPWRVSFMEYQGRVINLSR